MREAASYLSVVRTRGRRPKLTPEQKAMLFLLTRLNQKSNRDMEAMLALLGTFGVEVSYKTIERLYSDEEVELVLHNLFVLLLKERGISGHCSGTGQATPSKRGSTTVPAPPNTTKVTGMSSALWISRRGMYIAYGYSDRSEKQAFKKALAFLEREEIPLKSVRLDRYYSSRTDLRNVGPDVETFVLPKKNLSTFGVEWYRILNRIAEDPYGYLKEHFKRELSESYFGADKERFGRKIRQCREDRREMACFGIAVLHNVFSVRGG